MKWYIEFPILYVVVVVVLYSINYNTWGEASLFVSVVFGLILASVGYASYNEVKKKQKLKNASEEEKIKIKEKERKSNRIMIYAIIVMIIFCICIFAIALLI